MTPASTFLPPHSHLPVDASGPQLPQHLAQVTWTSLSRGCSKQARSQPAAHCPQTLKRGPQLSPVSAPEGSGPPATVPAGPRGLRVTAFNPRCLLSRTAPPANRARFVRLSSSVRRPVCLGFGLLSPPASQLFSEIGWGVLKLYFSKRKIPGPVASSEGGEKL